MIINLRKFITAGVLMNLVSYVLGNNNYPRQLEKIGGDEVLRREVEETGDIYQAREDSTRPPRVSHTLDPIGGGNLLRMIQPGETLRSELSKLASSDYLSNAENYRTDFLNILDRLTGGELTRSLDNVETADLILALENAMREENSNRHKRGMDSLLGETFGEMKRYIPMSALAKRNFEEMKRYIPMSALAKRNFDEIDNVGFNNWAKRPYTGKKTKKSPRMTSLALARRGFGSSRKYNVNSLAKRNFDEIDRTGFQGFLKREAK